MAAIQPCLPRPHRSPPALSYTAQHLRLPNIDRSRGLHARNSTDLTQFKYKVFAKYNNLQVFPLQHSSISQQNCVRIYELLFVNEVYSIE